MYYKFDGNQEQNAIYYRSMGKFFQIKAITDDLDECNKYCADNTDIGVIGTMSDGKHVIADFYGITYKHK